MPFPGGILYQRNRKRVIVRADVQNLAAVLHRNPAVHLLVFRGEGIRSRFRCGGVVAGQQQIQRLRAQHFAHRRLVVGLHRRLQRLARFGRRSVTPRRGSLCRHRLCRAAARNQRASRQHHGGRLQILRIPRESHAFLLSIFAGAGFRTAPDLKFGNLLLKNYFLSPAPATTATRSRKMLLWCAEVLLRRAVLHRLAHAGPSAIALGAVVIPVAAPPITIRIAMIVVETGLVLIALHPAVATDQSVIAIAPPVRLMLPPAVAADQSVIAVATAIGPVLHSAVAADQSVVAIASAVGHVAVGPRVIIVV